MRTGKVFLIAGAAAVLCLGFLAGQQAVKKLSAYGYVGRSGDATLVVDMDLARYRGAEKYIPIEVWMGHSGAKTITMDRGSFTLKDPKGKVHSLASVSEVTKGYGPSLVSNDYTYYGRVQNYASMLYLECRFIPRVAFFANPSGSPPILYDHVELPRQTFTRALLYFSNPEGKTHGTYTLVFNDAKSKTTIEIPFTIPWEK